VIAAAADARPERPRHRSDCGRHRRAGSKRFALGLGYAIERAMLVEHLRRQRDRVQRLVQATLGVAADLGETQLRLAREHARPRG
jgi:hypothetical protein